MTKFDVEAFIDRTRIGAAQGVALFVCVLICFIDGFDIFMIGKIAPAIAEGFGQPAKAMTPVLTYQQIGLALGAFITAPMADRLGRRFMLIIACIVFGVMTLACAWAQSLTQLAVLRGIAALFMSAGLPIAMALISEITPKRRRATLVAVALAGFSSGSAASGAVAAWMIDAYGWQSGFWIGGLVPIICVPLLIFFVPESLKLRAERNPNDPSIAATVKRLDPSVQLKGDEIFVLADSDAQGQKARLSDVFSGGRLGMTVIVWAACTLSMTSTALLAAWLPTFFKEMAGIPIQQFAIVAMIGYFGGVVGTLCVGWLMDRMRPALLLAFFYVMLAVCINGLAWVPFHASAFILLAVVWSFFQTGGQGGLNTMITQIYPPRMRSTALGWAGGAGRIGGIAAPVAGGFALEHQYSLQLTLGLAAILPIGVASLLLLLALVGRDRPEAAAQPAMA